MIEISEAIENEDQLVDWFNKLKSTLDNESVILLRGQVNHHNQIRSGKSRPDIKINKEIEHGWNNLVGRILSSNEQPFISSEKRQAILQHYGLATHYLDVTTNPLVAAWFAVNKLTKLEPILWVGLEFRNLNRVTYNPINEGFGYIHVFVISNREELEKKNKLIDIRKIEKFERPKRQDAFLLFDRPPLLPDINTFWKYTLKLERKKFRTSLSMRQLFPTPIEDKGYKFLLDVPFVQVPLPDKQSKSRESKGKRKILDFSFGVRSINVVEYVDDEKDDGGINHKWNDFTLFEPKAFREWQLLNLNLKKYFYELDSKFSNTVKITLSPSSKSFCEKNYRDVGLAWPDVNSNDIFLSFSQFQHDKVMDFLRPPFRGLWIHKENDLIIAVRVSIGWKGRINTKLYGIFILKDNFLEPQETNETNYPKNINIVTKEVSIALALHNLVKNGPLIFIPHPFAIPKWYYLL
ncbi:MAG TPA: FRG domain-containing protein [Fulvivirga sp.]|nr:FRG domain-containing protein [Fulvivirga sp.]